MMSLTVQLTRSRCWKQHCSDFECEECRQWWSKHEFRVGLENVAEKAQHSSLEITVYVEFMFVKFALVSIGIQTKEKQIKDT